MAADKHRTRGDKRFPGPEPLVLPWTPEVDVQTRVEPFCVEPGGKIHLEVVTPPKAAIAYHAVYADNKGGAPEPYGAGYGGNDDGFADPNGQFESDWVVSANAPFGPGRVDVIVGHDEKWGYDDPEFMVKKTC
ncbi:MAG: hypothetical protein ACRDJI_06125 [Actinomycetota bacterium]